MTPPFVEKADRNNFIVTNLGENQRQHVLCQRCLTSRRRLPLTSTVAGGKWQSIPTGILLLLFFLKFWPVSLKIPGVPEPLCAFENHWNTNNVFQAKERHHLQTSLLTVLRVINGFDIDVIESSDGESEVGDPEVWAPARLFRALSAHGWVANYQVSSLTQFIFFFNFNIMVV